MDCGIVGGQSKIIVLAGMMKRRREEGLELHSKAEGCINVMPMI